MKYKQLPWRQSDQKVFIADTAKAKRMFGWEPRTEVARGIAEMIEWTKSQI